jgi:hypothetical protein
MSSPKQRSTLLSRLSANGHREAVVHPHQNHLSAKSLRVSTQNIVNTRFIVLRTITDNISSQSSDGSHTDAEQDAVEWDGWPDGDWEKDFTWKQVEATKHLQVHWATRNNGGDRKGDDFATSWRDGRKSTRKCLGVIRCDNHKCERIVRPQTSARAIAKQVSCPCECGAQLSHLPCSVTSVLKTWAGGIHYINGGFHRHPRVTHVLHVSKAEEAAFRKIVENNPAIGPLGLLVGPRGLHSPGASVADISPAYLNIDRVAKDRRKLKGSNSISGDYFISEFTRFVNEHPGFVVFEQIGPVTVITVNLFIKRRELSDDKVFV